MPTAKSTKYQLALVTSSRSVIRMCGPQGAENEYEDLVPGPNKVTDDQAASLVRGGFAGPGQEILLGEEAEMSWRVNGMQMVHRCHSAPGLRYVLAGEKDPVRRAAIEARLTQLTGA